MSVVQKFRSDLPGWFWRRASHLVSVKMLARAVVIWRLDWGWGICFQNHSFAWLLAEGLSPCLLCLSTELLTHPHVTAHFLWKQVIQESKMKVLMSFKSNMEVTTYFMFATPYWFYKSALFSVGRDYTKTWITRRSSWGMSTRFKSWDLQNRRWSFGW